MNRHDPHAMTPDDAPAFGRRSFLAGSSAMVGLLGTRATRMLSASTTPRAAHVERVPPSAVPAPPDAVEFLVAGDAGADTPVRAQVVAAMSRRALRRAVEFVVLTGDNVYPRGVDSARSPELDRHFTTAFRARGLDVPFYPCLGNHDHQGSIAAQVEFSARDERWSLPAPYHAFRHDGATSVEVFVIDTNPLREASMLQPFEPEQVRWLEAALARSSAAWKIVVGHHPLLSGGTKGGSSSVRWWLHSLFERYHVDLYLAGHNHDLEVLHPGGSFLQVVSGAAANPRPLVRTPETLLHGDGGGFAAVTVGRRALWVELVSSTRGSLGVVRSTRRVPPPDAAP